MHRAVTGRVADLIMITVQKDTKDTFIHRHRLRMSYFNPVCHRCEFTLYFCPYSGQQRQFGGKEASMTVL